MTLVYGSDEVTKWVSAGIFGNSQQFKNCQSIGIVMDSRLIAGLVYSEMISRPDGTPYMIDMSIHSIDKRWANRHTLRAIFAYPFIQLRLERVQVLTSVLNEGVNSLVSRLGYIKEGEHRKAYPDGSDAFSYGMLKNECKWIKNG